MAAAAAATAATPQKKKSNKLKCLFSVSFYFFLSFSSLLGVFFINSFVIARMLRALYKMRSYALYRIFSRDSFVHSLTCSVYAYDSHYKCIENRMYVVDKMKKNTISISFVRSLFLFFKSLSLNLT